MPSSIRGIEYTDTPTEVHPGTAYRSHNQLRCSSGWQRTTCHDADTFSLLYKTYSSIVFGIAKGMVKSHTIAEDITQSVFLKLWSYRKPIPFEHVAGWVKRVARNTAIDVVRSRWFADVGFEEAISVPTGAADVPASALARAAYRAVLEAIHRLPEPQRRPIELAYIDGLSYSEVATKLCLPIGTAKSRIRKGLTLLYRSLRNA